MKAANSEIYADHRSKLKTGGEGADMERLLVIKEVVLDNPSRWKGQKMMKMNNKYP